MGRHDYTQHRWRRVRRRYLRNHPICEHQGCNQPATDVHHRDGQGLTGPNAYNESNLQALCHSHHSKITAREQPGGWHTKPRRRPPAQHPGLVG